MPLGGYAPLPLRLGADYDAAAHARIAADLAMMVRCNPLCMLTYTPGAPPVIHNYTGMNGAGLAWAPTPASNGTGDVTFTFPATFTDAYGVEFPVSIRYAKTTAHFDHTVGFICYAHPLFVTRNTVRVLTAIAGSGLGNNMKTTLTVY